MDKKWNITLSRGGFDLWSLHFRLLSLFQHLIMSWDESTSPKSHGNLGSDTSVVHFILICLPRILIYRNIKMRQHQALVFLLTEKGFVFVLLPKVKLIFTKQGQVITCVEQKSLHRPSRKRHGSSLCSKI